MCRLENSTVTTTLLVAYSVFQIANSFSIPGQHSLLLRNIKKTRYDVDETVRSSIIRDSNEVGSRRRQQKGRWSESSPPNHHYHQMRLRSNNNDDNNDFSFFFDEGEELSDFDTFSSSDGSDQAEELSGNRNRIRKFFRSSKDENLVRPIGLDGSLLDDNVDDSNYNNNNSNEQQTNNDSRSVVRPKFDSFFKGVPGIGDILGPSSNQQQQRPEMDENEAWKQSLERQQQSQGGSGGGVQDTNLDVSGLTQDDIEAIDDNFEKFQREMREKLAKLRQEDPDSVPDNAEFILDQVVEEQRVYDLKEKKDSRSFESFEEYQKQKKKEMENQLQLRYENNVEEEQPSVVKDILQETQRINDRRESDEKDLFDFAQYEQSMKESNNLRVQKSRQRMDDSTWNNDDADMIQLKLMEDLLQSRKKSVAEAGLEDEDIYTTDNLEDGVEELRALIEQKKSGGKKSGPTSLKDWQMYRAIATKLSAEDDDLNMNVDENLIEQQLQAWKEFQIKEEEMRKKSGLTIKTRLPFPWSDKVNNSIDNDRGTTQPIKQKSSVPFDKIKSAEARSELDDKAVEMMESLIGRTVDATRRLKLQRELVELKAEMKLREDALERLRNLPPPSEKNSPVANNKVDVSDVFQNNDDNVSFSPPVLPTPSYGTAQISDEAFTPPPQPSASSFYSSIDDNANLSNRDDVIDAPKTPFFASDDEDFDDYEDDDSLMDDNETMDRPSLGTLEEQKFRSMVARSGVRTVEGQEELRKKWEDFKKAEAEMRSRTGLSEGTDGSDLTDQTANLKYDLSQVLKDGGDIDADVVLASIGQRPSRKNKKYDQRDETASFQTIPDNPENDEEMKWTGSTYADQLFRNVAAVNRGMSGTSSDEKIENKAAFEEFLKKDEEMRQKMQNLSSEMPVGNGEDFDAESYAQNALSSIGSRPQINRRRNVVSEDERQYNVESELTEAIEENENELKKLSLRKEINRQLPSSISEKMPNWLRREQEERGFAEEFNLSNEDTTFTEDYTDQVDFEENLRQAEEFERKTSRAPKQISIGDIFGRDYFGPDDYGDYYSSGKGGDNSFSSFEARKNNLLEYTELSVAELNKLMDYKNSALETGISPYLRMVNKPFSAFGAVFRLESILVDLTGIQATAWTATAKEYGLKLPSREDIKFAAVHKPDFVIQRVFYWTSDILETRNIVKTYKEKLSIAFEEWIESTREGNASELSTVSSINDNTNLSDNGKSSSAGNLSQENILNLRLKAWIKVAEQLNKTPPTMDMIFLSKPFSPDEAVRGVFKWTNSYSESIEIGNLFRSILKIETKTWMTINNIKLPNTNENPLPNNSHDSPSSSVVPESNPLTPEIELTNVKIKAWAKTAEMFDYNAPTVDEVQAAAFTGVENAVSKVFKWSQDPIKVNEVVMTFRNYTKIFANGLMNRTAENMRQKAASKMSQSEVSDDDLEPVAIKDGVIQWIKSLQVLSLPCALVSYLNKSQVEAILEYTGLSALFSNSTIVTSSDNYATENQQMLGAALRIERRPDHCVMFDATQQATTAAHDIEMKSISIVDPYPYYELTTCDLSGRDFESLGTSRIRNVFNDASNQEPMQELQLEEPMRKNRPMLKTRFWEEGDRW